jgi:hypothetical protein
LVFSKDGADNFYVRSDEPGVTGVHRLVFLADADAGYFAPRLPDDPSLTAARVFALAPAEIRPRLPAKVRAVAERVLREHLRVRATDRLSTSFDQLVAFFRAFEAKDLPVDTGDIYRDLCDTQAGVCRHRSFAFMVTANALGLPTRFVSNEAHAFVEVWFPKRGWQRVDLGGAALRLEVSGGEDKTLHRPRAEDPFAKPKEYRDNYTQLEGDIRGLRSEQISDRRKPSSEAPSSGDFDGAGSSGGSGAGPGSGAGTDEARAGDPPSDSGRITPNRSLPIAEPDPGKRTPVLVITRADPVTYRGGILHLEGRATVDGKPLADHPLDVFLSTAGRRGEDSRPLPRIFTAADGTFAADLKVPAGLSLAPHELHVSSPEDATYNGALSQ